MVNTAIPKIHASTEAGILKRLTQEDRLKKYLQRGTPNVVYYTRKLRYFVQFFDFIPSITDSVGNILVPSELKELYFADEDQSIAALAALNSNLFFWFMTVHSDVRNLNRREIEEFPCSLDKLGSKTVRRLRQLAGELMDDFKANSRILTNNYGQYGVLSIQSFQPRESKPIIDEIDRVLAQHYGFTDEELDFIINYDIKYRMGRDADAGDESEGE